MSDPKQHVIIDYTNWRGERALRRIIPLSIQFENSEWHPDTQWILYAVDIDRGASREFAMANVHSWTVPQPASAVGPSPHPGAPSRPAESNGDRTGGGK